LEWLSNAARANIPATNQFDLQKKIGSPWAERATNCPLPITSKSFSRKQPHNKKAVEKIYSSTALRNSQSFNF
jgi:hypothetical protein